MNKVVESDNLIPVSGASIKSADDLWGKVLAWMEGPISRTEKTEYSGKVEVGGRAGGEAGIPLVAKGKAEAEGKIGGELKKSTERVFALEALQQVIKDIAGSDYTVFIDDFHYIQPSEQEAIGRQIKEATEAGVRICAASVPHRADDVVRSNPELRGRVVAINTERWTESELEQIGYKGFQAMNMDIAPSVLKKLASEAFGSPQLMQAICLNLCFELHIEETLPAQKRIDPNLFDLQNIFERTSTYSDFSTMVNRLHAGPKLRGAERKEFKFNDDTVGDVYRSVLLAIKTGSPNLTIAYDDMMRRIREVCIDNAPSGSSVSNTLGHMTDIASTVQVAPVIEWEEDTLHIIEPYFLFFLRNSKHLKQLKS